MSVPPPVLPTTIIAFGDSTTAPRNVGAINNGRPIGSSTQGANQASLDFPPHNIVNNVDETSSMLYVYSDVLRDELSSLGYSLAAVDNEGIGGNRTDQALQRLNSDVRAKNPDVVILQYGINDSWVDSGVPTGLSRVPLNADDQIGHPNASKGNYEDNLTSIVQTLKADGVEVIIMTPSPVSSTLYPLWRIEREGLYAQAARDVAAAENTQLVDIWDLYMDYDTLPGQSLDDLLLADGQHPGPLGHFMTANALLSVIVPEPTSLMLCSFLLMLVLPRYRKVCVAVSESFVLGGIEEYT